MNGASEGARPRFLILMPNWLGDTLFATPALRALRKTYPSARIECAAPLRCRPALKLNPYVDALHVYDERVRWTRPSAVLRLAGLLAKGRYDTVIVLGHSVLKTALAALFCVPARVGPTREGKIRLVTADAGPVDPGTHRADQYLRIIETVGARADGRRMDFLPDPEARERACALTAGVRASGRRYAAVHVGGNWDLKRWPAAHFGAWLDAYLARTPDGVVFCGTKAEEPLVREVLGGRSDVRVCDLTGRTDLSELAWVLRESEFLLTNDSGPMHVAATQGTPIVGLFGPTSPALTGPITSAAFEAIRVDVGCQIPCYYRSCDRRVCMDWIAVDAVLEACLRLRGPRTTP